MKEDENWEIFHKLNPIGNVWKLKHGWKYVSQPGHCFICFFVQAEHNSGSKCFPHPQEKKATYFCRVEQQATKMMTKSS